MEAADERRQRLLLALELAREEMIAKLAKEDFQMEVVKEIRIEQERYIKALMEFLDCNGCE